MILPEVSTLDIDVLDDLSRAHEAYIALQVYRVYCQLRSISSDLCRLQAELDEQIRREAAQRIEEEAAQRAWNSRKVPNPFVVCP